MWPFRLSGSGMNGRLKTMSRIAAATSAFVVRGRWRSVSAVSDRDLVVAGVEADARRRETSLTTTASSCLRASLPRPYSSAPSPVSAAKPTSVWSGRRRAASAESTSSVRSRRSASSSPASSFLILPVRGAGRPVVGDGGGHQQQVARVERVARRRRRARRRSRRRRSGRRDGAAARRSPPPR